MIAIPDFAAGAMENWGLMLYRETALLYDYTASSASNKQRVATVVSHELAHQVCLPYFVHYATIFWPHHLFFCFCVVCYYFCCSLPIEIILYL